MGLRFDALSAWRAFRLAALVPLAVYLVALPGIAGAASFPLPRSDYPPSTRFQYFPDWTNRQFDCNFGWDCDLNLPYLHTRTEDQLHRVSGWALWGHWHDDTMGFELYSSIYAPAATPSGTDWSYVAAQDEHGALDGLNAGTETRTIPAVLPCGVSGRTFAVWVDRPGWHVLFVTVSWGGTREIEAAALYPRKRKWEARRYLVEQVRAAVLVADQASPSSGYGVDGACP